MLPALTAKCLREPFSKPRMTSPHYTQDSSGHVLTLPTPQGYSSHCRVYNTVNFQPWVCAYAVPPPGVPSLSWSRKSSTEEGPAKQWPQCRRVVGVFVCVCVCARAPWLQGCRCEKKMEAFIQIVHEKDDSIWVDICGGCHSSYHSAGYLHEQKEKLSNPHLFLGILI